MHKLLTKINFKLFIVIFTAFFFLEYGSGAINAYKYAIGTGLTVSEFLQQSEFSKYVYRFIFYGLVYWIFFDGLHKKKEGAYYLLQILFVLHIISKVFILGYSAYTGVLLKYFGSTFTILAFVWNISIILMYCFFVMYIAHYRKNYLKKK